MEDLIIVHFKKMIQSPTMNNRSILFQQGSVKSKIGFRNIPMDSDLCTNDFQCMQLIKPKRKEPIFSSLFPTLFGKSFFTQFIVFVIFLPPIF